MSPWFIILTAGVGIVFAFQFIGYEISSDGNKLGSGSTGISYDGEKKRHVLR